MRKADATKLLEEIDPDNFYFEIRERVINKEESFTQKDAVEVLDWIAEQLTDEDKANKFYDQGEGWEDPFAADTPVYKPDPRD